MSSGGLSIFIGVAASAGEGVMALARIGCVVVVVAAASGVAYAARGTTEADASRDSTSLRRVRLSASLNSGVLNSSYPSLFSSSMEVGSAAVDELDLHHFMPALLTLPRLNSLCSDDGTNATADGNDVLRSDSDAARTDS